MQGYRCKDMQISLIVSDWLVLLVYMTDCQFQFLNKTYPNPIYLFASSYTTFCMYYKSDI